MSFEIIILLIAIAIFLFIAFLLILAVIVIFFRKQVEKFLKPDPNDIQRDLERLRLKYPNLGVDEIASNYVSEQAKFLGLVGFMTEVWGFFIPVLGFTIDASFTTLRQMRMVYVITALYGGKNTHLDAEQMQVQYQAVVGASSLIPRLILKFVIGEVPIVGGIANAIINWVVTNEIGKVAIGWNTGKTVREVMSEQFDHLKNSTLSLKDSAINIVKPNSKDNSDFELQPQPREIRRE